MEHIPREAPLTLTLAAGVLIAVAYLVGRLAPERRRHVRHGVVVLGALVLAFTVRAASSAFATPLPYGEQVTDALTHVFAVLLFGVAFFDIALARVRVDVSDIVRDLIMGLAYLGVIGVAFHRAGVQISSIVASGAVVTLVLGLSLQATLGNAVGGLALHIDGSVREGDWLRLADQTEGRVVSVRWRHTMIETRNGDTVIVPNAKLLGESFLVLGKSETRAPLHRMWVWFEVDYRTSPERVIEVVEKGLRGAPIEGVAQDPLPDCVCKTLGDKENSSVARYGVRYWLTDLARDDPTSSRVNARIYTVLQRAGIPLAIPAATVFMTEENQKRRIRKVEAELARRTAMLEDLPLFAPLTPEERAELAPKLHPAPFGTGEVITRQGAEAHWLYILAEGSADISVKTDAGGSKVASLSAPDIFGEAGLLTGEPRAATVTASCPVLCLRLDKEDFRATLTKRPEIADQLSRILVERKMEREQLENELDAESKRQQMVRESSLVFGKIQRFFGLDDEAYSRRGA